MREYQSKVKDFMLAVGQPCREKPSTPSDLERIGRVKFLLEEVLEFAEASGISVNIDESKLEYTIISPPNLVEIADSIADISYINYGSANSYGLDMEPFENEVHENNLTKVKTGYIDNSGKLRKGPDYKPVDLKPILERQLNA